MKTGQLNIMLLLSAFFVLFSNPIFAQQHLRSRVSWVEVVEDPQDVQQEPVRTYYSYDAHGNVKALLQQLPGMPAKRTDYVYDLVSGNVNMVIYQYGASDQMIQKYRYDADNRLQQVHTSTDGYVWNQEAMYKYYAHGPLARIELGKHRVQGLDYYYTLQGWLKGVNGSTEGNDPGQDGMGISRVSKDAFAFALGYFEGDYQGIGAKPTTNQLWTRLNEQYSQDPPNPYKGLYNGNIAWMQTDLPGLQDKPEQAMLYRYDQLNRLVLARGLNQYDASSGFAARSGSTGPYDAAYSYDPNGNLLSLDRHKQDGSLLDEFDYSYTANTNRLASVEDASLETITYDEKIYDNGPIRHDGNVYRSIIAKDNATAEAGQTAQLLQANESITLQPSFHAKAGSGFHAKWTNASNTEDEVSDFAYEYDAIGNLTHDRGEGTDITWTPYGKVRTVSKGDGTAISYQHDAAGNRISKRVTSNNQTKTTHYVRDASGNVLSIYQDEALQEQPIYGSSRLGMYRPKDSKADGSLSLGQRNYELSNHLGNVLSVITDEVKINTDGLHEPVILQTQDYRPFGLRMAGRSYVGGGENRYLYNGKELQNELGLDWYDYGARMYDPALGRFSSVDRFASKYVSLSPYNYAANNPINLIDINGDSLWIAYNKGFLGLGGKGSLLYNDGNLYNKDGSAYAGKVKGFLKTAVSNLDQISVGQEGNKLVDELQSSTDNITIIKGTAGKGNSYNTVANEVTFDVTSQNGGLNTRGTTDRPTFVGLAHELYHGLDDIRGTVSGRRVGNTIQAEIFASHGENLIRAENFLPLRTQYNSGTPIIDAFGNSIYYGNNYYDDIKLKSKPARALVPAATIPTINIKIQKR